MSLNDIRQRASVIHAIRKYQSLGRDQFLSHYGFGRAREFFLIYEGQAFDSKAIVGAAHGFEHPDQGPLTSGKFSGGEATVRRKLEELGFEVQRISSADQDSRKFAQAVQRAESQLAATGQFDAENDEDARDRVTASIVRRRGQPAFRAALLEAYGGKCAVSSCDVEAVLEGAHIKPYLGPYTNVVVNGVLLRADLHTLFDLGLLAIHPDDLTISIAPPLRTSAYGRLHGSSLRVPANRRHRPDITALRQRFNDYCNRFTIE